MSGWQPPRDPRRQQSATPPQWQQMPQEDPWQASRDRYQPAPQPRYEARQQQPAAPQYRLPAQPSPRRSQGGSYGPWIALGAAILVAVAGAAFWVLHSRAASAGGNASAQPGTEAGLRNAATQFYALYAAGQWAQSWALLAPASQQGVPESTYVAVHEDCPTSSDGVARVIKSVTMAGSSAVVTETFAGSLGSVATVADAWTYAGGRWGISLAPSSMADYSHGSAKADVAAMKAAGDCTS